MVDKEGKLQARVSGPVWNTLPQTPQAAEFVALAVAAELAQGPSIVYDDCSNVVREFHKPLNLRLAGKRPYAGIMKFMLQWPGYHLISNVIK
eukprot:12474858-Heterocapsa_arctica.AAC.1